MARISAWSLRSVHTWRGRARARALTRRVLSQMFQARVHDEYDLILSADSNPKQHAFWFFFRVSGPGMIAKVRSWSLHTRPTCRTLTSFCITAALPIQHCE